MGLAREGEEIDRLSTLLATPSSRAGHYKSYCRTPEPLHSEAAIFAVPKQGQSRIAQRFKAGLDGKK
jgi:hypothetical protein